MLRKENAKLIETIRSRSGSTYKVFTFECSECSKDIRSQLCQLKRHSGKCRVCSQRKKPYEHIINELNYTCKSKTGLSITITYDEFVEIIKDSKCHYCDKELIYNEKSRDINGKKISRAYQLDRKDNNKGYTFENSVPCCFKCNQTKSNRFTYEEFIKLSPALKEIEKNCSQVKPSSFHNK